jgi:hypothetical protein
MHVMMVPETRVILMFPFFWDVMLVIGMKIVDVLSINGARIAQ